MAISAERIETELGEAIRLVYENSEAIIHPGLGFNCTSWTYTNSQGEKSEILAPSPDWKNRPTRGGHPILFPFPNRLKDGLLIHEGKEYQLPKNDSTGKHAIHGFTPRASFKWTNTKETISYISVSISFIMSEFMEGKQAVWPGDAKVVFEYFLSTKSLTIVSTIQPVKTLPDTFPFGLGYHPYFRPPGLKPGEPIDNAILHFHPLEQWEAEGNIPTGVKLPPLAEHDFRVPREIGPLNWDHGYAAWEPLDLIGSSRTMAALKAKGTKEHLEIVTDNNFSNAVVFIPPDRQSIAIEPYTCATDASNLELRGIPAGWKSLHRLEYWTSFVTYRIVTES